jgi:hypothetical protein
MCTPDSLHVFVFLDFDIFTTADVFWVLIGLFDIERTEIR